MKSIVFTACENEYMNICPPFPIYRSPAVPGKIAKVLNLLFLEKISLIHDFPLKLNKSRHIFEEYGYGSLNDR